MIFFWKIRYFDRGDKEFKDRCLYLDPETIPIQDLACIEFLSETRKHNWDRKILKFRHLFREVSKNERKKLWHKHCSSGIETILLDDYVEDEDGNVIALQEALRIKYGNPNLVLVPQGMSKHLFKYLNAPDPAFDISQITLSEKEIDAFLAFSRDYNELKDSTFRKDFSSLSLHVENEIYDIRSSFTDEDIRAFVAIFRRLYKANDNDPGHYENVCKVYQEKIQHPSARYLEVECNKFQSLKESTLEKSPDNSVLLSPIRELISFGQINELSVEKFLDTIIYTRYLHQPKKSRKELYQTILNSIKKEEKEDILNWIFLSLMNSLSLHIINTGGMLEYAINRYLETKNTEMAHIPQMTSLGIGKKESYEEKKKRIVDKKITELSEALWKQDGNPACGLSGYKKQAELIIKDLISKE